MLSPLSITAALAFTGFSTASPFHHQMHNASSSCDQSAVNTTRTTYTIQTNDTIFSIAAAVNGGACDIARYNKLADAEMLTVGMTLLIPEQLCPPDDTTCLLNEETHLNTCILGGPHDYLTVETDTPAKIALRKFYLTLDTITALLGTNDSSAAITVGTQVKIPQCDPSRCVVKPYHLTYGTYKDLAEKVGTTPGQLLAFNPGYNVSTDGPGTGPVITVPWNCTLESEDFTVES